MPGQRIAVDIAEDELDAASADAGQRLAQCRRGFDMTWKPAVFAACPVADRGFRLLGQLKRCGKGAAPQAVLSDTTMLPPPATMILQSRASSVCTKSAPPSGSAARCATPPVRQTCARRAVILYALAEPIDDLAHNGVDAAIKLNAGPAEISRIKTVFGEQTAEVAVMRDFAAMLKQKRMTQLGMLQVADLHIFVFRLDRAAAAFCMRQRHVAAQPGSAAQPCAFSASAVILAIWPEQRLVGSTSPTRSLVRPRSVS